jgi:hypothetical protein
LTKEKELKHKFDSLLLRKSPKTTPEVPSNLPPKPNFVTNLTDHEFTDDQMSILNKGLKYKPATDVRSAVENIVINVESTIKNMDIPDKILIRKQCADILKKLPSKCN